MHIRRSHVWAIRHHLREDWSDRRPGREKYLNRIVEDFNHLKNSKKKKDAAMYPKERSRGNKISFLLSELCM